MNFEAFRQELVDFYWYKVNDMADAFQVKMFDILDKAVRPTMTANERKVLQYKTITEHCTPILFHTSPFYH